MMSDKKRSIKVNRETERQVARLNNLADFIEANPEQYGQDSSDVCIIGLGLRLKRTELGGVFRVFCRK